MTTRTSHTHPLQIAEVRAGAGLGRVGLTFCPGKCQSNAWSGSWERNLDIDLDAIRDWGAAAVVTLVEDHELDALNVRAMGAAVAERYMSWYHLPTPDVSVPCSRFEEQWVTAGEELRALIREGFDVLIHCKGGLGRAGTVSARLLIELGWLADDAIAAVRGVRPGAIENDDQLRHVRKQQAMDEANRLSEVAERSRAIGALLGLAVGDAVGTTLEFKPRDSHPRLEDMVGGGPFRLQAGEWTDDTAMALALADSLVAHPELDERDLMQRFVSWWRRGRYSCTGSCFDIGITTSQALQRFERTGDPVAGSANPRSAGNGSLMRLAPAVLNGFRTGECGGGDVPRRQSATTHAAEECLDACQGFAHILYLAITGRNRSRVLRPATGTTAAVTEVLEGSWRGKPRDEIRSSGYVVHSLEAAIWCVARTSNFRDAVLLAANLGDDADTTAAITGQLAGAFYGVEGIPEEWLGKLAWRGVIEELAEKLLGDVPFETDDEPLLAVPSA